MTRPRSNLEVQFDTFNYRQAEEILNAHLAIRREITAALEEVQETKVAIGKDSLTPRIVAAFTKRGWEKRSWWRKISRMNSDLICSKTVLPWRLNFPAMNFFRGIIYVSFRLTTQTKLMSAF